MQILKIKRLLFRDALFDKLILTYYKKYLNLESFVCNEK